MKFSIDDIEADESFEEFLNARGIIQKTRKRHIYLMTVFCNFQGQKPIELIEEAEEDETKGIKKRKRRIKRKLINYVVHLKQNKKATSTIKGYLTDIKAFYDYHDIDLPKLPKNIYENKDLKLRNIAFDEVPEIEHIKKACNTTKIRFKTMILLHFSSGMGASEVRNLTYRDFILAVEDDLQFEDPMNIVNVANKAINSEKIIPTWKLGRYKKARPYVTFSSPESVRAIGEYLLYRLHNNETIKDMDDYLFVTRKNTQIADITYNTAFERLNNRCGFGKRKNGFHFFTSHRLRVAFGTAAKECGVDPVDIRRMLGQKGEDLDDAYLKTTAVRLKNEYMKFVHLLSIEKLEVIQYGDQDVLSLVNRIEELEKGKEEDKEFYRENVKPLLHMVDVLNKDPDLLEKYKEAERRLLEKEN